MSHSKKIFPCLSLAAFLVSPQLCHSTELTFSYEEETNLVWWGAVQEEMKADGMTVEMNHDEGTVNQYDIYFSLHKSPELSCPYIHAPHAFNDFYAPLPPLSFDIILNEQLSEPSPVDIYLKNLASRGTDQYSAIPQRGEGYKGSIDSVDSVATKPIKRSPRNTHHGPLLGQAKKDRIVNEILQNIPMPPQPKDKQGWEKLAKATKSIWNPREDLTYISFSGFLNKYLLENQDNISQQRYRILENLRNDQLPSKRK
jgi:hypothetical protein